MKAVRRKTQATVERTWVSGVRIVDRAVINLDRLSVGHTATKNDELVCHLV